jgi:hypothetical protein
MALGITDTSEGSKAALKTVFSFEVWETQMTWPASMSANLRSLLVWILDASANPKREWSVKQVLYPIMRPRAIPSRHKTEKACEENFALIFGIS